MKNFKLSAYSSLQFFSSVKSLISLWWMSSAAGNGHRFTLVILPDNSLDCSFQSQILMISSNVFPVCASFTTASLVASQSPFCFTLATQFEPDGAEKSRKPDGNPAKTGTSNSVQSESWPWLLATTVYTLFSTYTHLGAHLHWAEKHQICCPMTPTLQSPYFMQNSKGASVFHFPASHHIHFSCAFWMFSRHRHCEGYPLPWRSRLRMRSTTWPAHGRDLRQGWWHGRYAWSMIQALTLHRFLDARNPHFPRLACSRQSHKFDSKVRTLLTHCRACTRWSHFLH